MQNSGYNNTTLKQQNRGLILKLIATGEGTTRIDLARKTGLSKMAATNIVGEFLADEVLEECQLRQVKGKGRNPMELRISPKAPKLLGVYLYRDECSVVLCDLQLRVLKKTGFLMTEERTRNMLPLLCQSIDAVLAASQGERIYGIGIGSLGPVDVDRGMILNPPNFYGQRDLEVVAFLKEKYQLPVYFDSQYNCAALAEKYYGNGKAEEDFLFVGISTGIGSGVIQGGRLCHNQSGLTSELGHVSIDWNGARCVCGNRGCLEAYAGSDVIKRRVKELTGEDLSFQECSQRAAEDASVAAVFEDMTVKLACALTSAVNLFNPQKVIIGHEGYWIPDHMLEKLEEEINQRKLSGRYRHVKVEKSFFEAEATIRGCACSLLMQIFEGVLF